MANKTKINKVASSGHLSKKNGNIFNFEGIKFNFLLYLKNLNDIIKVAKIKEGFYVKGIYVLLHRAQNA